MQPNPQSYVSFGPFTYDACSGELRKHNTRLRLTGQPQRVLDVLLERPGQVVSREELQLRLWKGTTFVDFEHGLNVAINKLRQTLGDSVERPRYIETIPGRGYRFICTLRGTSPKGVVEMVQRAEAYGAGREQNYALADTLVSRRAAPRTAVILGLVFMTAVVSVVMWTSTRTRRGDLPRQTLRYRVPIPEAMHLSNTQSFSLSPDGRTLVYYASRSGEPMRLWAQTLDSLDPRVLPGTETRILPGTEMGADGGDPPPFWSPDSKTLVFYANESLKRTDLSGGLPRVICGVPGKALGGSWNREGIIIFGTTTGSIMRVPAAGGEPVPVAMRDAQRDERVLGFPSFLPDGRHFLYSRLSAVPENNGVFVGSLDVKPSEQELRRLVTTPIGAQFIPSSDRNGKLLFVQNGTLWAQDFDLSRPDVAGEPVVIAEQVGNSKAFGFFSASASGVLVYRSGLPGLLSLTWFDRRGQRLATAGEPSDLYAPPVLSPDGSRIALAKFHEADVAVWVHDLSRNVSQKLTSDPALHTTPVWSPDGKRIAFSSSRSGHYDLYQIRASGEDLVEDLLYASREDKFLTSWSPDGRFLLYDRHLGGTASNDLWMLPLDQTGKGMPLPLLHSRANQGSGQLSPDGHWLAYVSDESGTTEVYVLPFAEPDASAKMPAVPKLLVSRGGGTQPHWRADGKALFYSAPDGTLMSVAFSGHSERKLEVPQALFHLPGPWYAAGNGDQFLAAVREHETAPPFTVIVNWQGLRK